MSSSCPSPPLFLPPHHQLLLGMTSDVIHPVFKLQLSLAPFPMLTLNNRKMKQLMLMSVMSNSAIFHGCASVLPRNQTVKDNCIYSVCKTNYTFKLNTVLNCYDSQVRPLYSATRPHVAHNTASAQQHLNSVRQATELLWPDSGCCLLL